MDTDKTLAIIPARYASTRFPGKPLVEIQGRSMIRRVYEQAMKAELIDEVIVATDDERILQHVQDFGGQARMTSDQHRSGTDRCAEVAAANPGFDRIVNIQGDEPFIAPRQIDQVVRPLMELEHVAISTLAKRLTDPSALFDPNVVKVVFDATQKALYFSRSTIPYLRDVPREEWLASADFYKHIGIYGFRREVLLAIAQLSPGLLERNESLEQLRWLEAGYAIHVGITQWETIGIDRPEDLSKVENG
ncbi:MAG: 3-deoxy-manno-octulosonate cytidylyltransferase [Saprospiraceae bacterium]|nr:3-deoxy-manno-octulosonate cytidylyltransferase [Lewinella sp.]